MRIKWINASKKLSPTWHVVNMYAINLSRELLLRKKFAQGIFHKLASHFSWIILIMDCWKCTTVSERVCGVQLLATQEPIIRPGCWEVCFISDASTWGWGRANICPKADSPFPPPTLATNGARAFIDRSGGNYMQKQHCQLWQLSSNWSSLVWQPSSHWSSLVWQSSSHWSSWLF